jgi:serine/threonine-protein kinase
MVNGRTWRVRAAMLSAAVTIAGGAATTARAQSSGDQAAAEALFKQGRDLMAAGHLAEACPKLAESQRLDPGTGTLLNLATCYERNGQIASAWVTYKEAATAAQNADQAERAQLARRKAAELEPKLSMLTIVVPAAADRPDLQIRRDGQVIGRPGWGVPIPVDPGVHTIEATAAGRKPWQGQASVEGAAAQASVEVPPLAEVPVEASAPSAPAPAAAPAPTAAAPALAPAAPPAHASMQRTLGLVTGAVGIAGLIVGATFGFIAQSDNNDAKTHCKTDTSCDPTGVSQTNSALHAATASTVAFIAGGALTAAGLALWLTAPPGGSESGGHVAVAPFVGPAAGGLALHGGW